MLDTRQAERAHIHVGMAIADLQTPLILQRHGNPMAVIIPIEEYARLQTLAIDEVERKRAGWVMLDDLLADIRNRSTDLSPAQIEEEISAASDEVRNSRRRAT